MNNSRIPLKFHIKVSFEKNNHELIVNFNTTVAQLKQMVFNYFKLNYQNYALYYKDNQLSLKDARPISLVFYKNNSPLIFIIEKKAIKSNKKNDTSITLYTKYDDKKFSEIVSKFFEYKAQPFDCSIKNPVKGMYIIIFRKSVLAHEFKQFYDINFSINSNTRAPKIPRLLPFSGRNNSNNTINTNSSSITTIPVKYETQSSAMKRILQFNDRSDKICRKNLLFKINKSGSCSNIKSKRVLKQILPPIKKEKYKGMYMLPFMNPDEKYYREKYLDKINWIDKKGFILSVGHYKMNGADSRYIKNYVTATPSEPPVNHKFRECNKNNWINKKGFIL